MDDHLLADRDGVLRHCVALRNRIIHIGLPLVL